MDDTRELVADDLKLDLFSEFRAGGGVRKSSLLKNKTATVFMRETNHANAGPFIIFYTLSNSINK
jgi:hypothetical protein